MTPVPPVLTPQRDRALGRIAAVDPVARPGESLPASAAPLIASPRHYPTRSRAGRVQRLRTSLNTSVTEGAVAEVFGACAGGAVLTGWALYLGAGPVVIGLIGALPLAAQVLQLPAAWLTQAVGAKRLAVAAIAASRLAWLPLIALPFLHLAPATTLALFVGVVGIAAVFGVIGNNAWTAWMGELVPGQIRGRFFGQRMVYLTLSGTVASLAAGLALDAFGPRGWRGETLAVLAAIACDAGAVSIWLLLVQQAPCVSATPAEAGDWRTALVAARDAKARALLVYCFGWNAAVGLSASFFSYHMLENLKLGFGLAAAHGIAVAVVRIVSAPVWGRLVDRCGARPVVALCSFGVASVPAIWLFATPDRLWPIAVEAVIAGALWGGHGIAAFHLSLGLSPGPRRPFYLAGFAMAGGVGFAVSSSLAGALVYMLPSRLDVLGWAWVDIHVLFALSAIARAAAAGLALRIDEPAARSVAELVRALFAPIRHAWSAPRPGPAT